MQPKKYQLKVLSDLRKYTKIAAETNDARQAYNRFWENEGVTPSPGNERVFPYNDTLNGVPRVTAKVPTAGGKTFIACNALKEIIDNYIPTMNPKVIVWFVPSEPILKQTLEKLCDSTHPYRQQINKHFSGNVQVYGKEDLLAGRSFTPAGIQSQLSVLVLEIQSFASVTRDLLSYKDNEHLYPFTEMSQNLPKIENADESSLIRILASLNPVVIVDESHNFQGKLRIETINLINPRFVYELTATPKDTSNVISTINALELKAEHMVKLPVIVSNRRDTEDLLYAAINLRRHLEKKAELEDNYIRPIVLFQAEPKTKEDATTFDKLKQSLKRIGIPDEEIAIKVSSRDELKGWDLMDAECPIRYIITVNALKEGWDCPFAYILATIADKNSDVDVEQILGRVLRLPYAERPKAPELEMSYVLTSSAKFAATLQRIVDAMNRAGYDRDDIREHDDSADIQTDGAEQLTLTPVVVAEEEGSPEQVTTSGFITIPCDVPETASSEHQVSGDETKEEYPQESFDTETVKEKLDNAGDVAATQIINNAVAQNEEYVKRVSTMTSNIDGFMDKKTYRMRGANAGVASALRLPEFYVKTSVNSIFGDYEEVKLTFKYLLKGFDLSRCDKNITFSQVNYEAKQIDISDTGAAVLRNIKSDDLMQLNEYFKGLSDKSRRRTLSELIYRSMRNIDTIDESMIKSYIKDVLSEKTEEEIAVLQHNLANTVDSFNNKIIELCIDQARRRFYELKDSNKLFVKQKYSFPEKITVNTPLRGLDNGLYVEEENNLNNLEMKVLTEISLLDNVSFWHRNDVRGEGFGIHGFLPYAHYPDFIIVFKSGVVAMVETKGSHLKGPESAGKIELGSQWSAMARGADFKYFMVYEDSPIEGAKTLNELMQILKTL